AGGRAAARRAPRDRGRAAPPEAGVTAAVPALRLRGVYKSFGRTEIIRGVDLAVASGERHAIIGPNGAGKSTLFNLISARFPVSSGAIELKGEDVSRLRPFEMYRRGVSR